SSTWPAVTGLAGGGFVVSWTSSGGSQDDVYAQLFDASGVAQGSAFRVNTYVSNYQSFSPIVALADGGFIVSWNSSEQDGSGYGVYGQRFDATGAPVGSEFRISESHLGNQAASLNGPMMVQLANGDLVATWSDDSYGYGDVLHRTFAVGPSAV